MSELEQINEAAKHAGMSVDELARALREYSQRVSLASQDEDQ